MNITAKKCYDHKLVGKTRLEFLMNVIDLSYLLDTLNRYYQMTVDFFVSITMAFVVVASGEYGPVFPMAKRYNALARAPLKS